MNLLSWSTTVDPATLARPRSADLEEDKEREIYAKY